LFTKDIRTVSRERNIFSPEHQPQLHLDIVVFSRCNKIKNESFRGCPEKAKFRKKEAVKNLSEKTKRAKLLSLLFSLCTSPQMRLKSRFLVLSMHSICPVTYCIALPAEQKRYSRLCFSLTTLLAIYTCDHV